MRNWGICRLNIDSLPTIKLIGTRSEKYIFNQNSHSLVRLSGIYGNFKMKKVLPLKTKLVLCVCLIYCEVVKTKKRFSITVSSWLQ